ncbi:MAG: hypothetical protein IKE74_04880 [Mogibacterium sp.]|nr:hypothetical protein [Mogibacterium sp.]
MSPNKRRLKTKKETVRVRKARTNFRYLKNLEMNLHQWIRLFSAVSVVVMLVVTIAGIVLYNHYHEYPGKVQRDTVTIADRGADYIDIKWEEPHNVDEYKVFFREYDPKTDEEEIEKSVEGKQPDDSWHTATTHKGEIKIEGLVENTKYAFVIRGDNKKHSGHPTKHRDFRTKKSQEIKVDKNIMRFTFSEPFRIDPEASTATTFRSDNEEVATVNEATGEVTVRGAGEANISIKAAESKEYEGASEVVNLKVIESEPVDSGGAPLNVIYWLDADNCEVVKTITGDGAADIPQGLAYTGDKYIVAYGMGSPNRIISFDVEGDGKEVSVPGIDLGKPNGFAYSDAKKLCYCVKGYSSRAVTYDPETGEYDAMSFAYGCSGIGYDRKNKWMYTSSFTVMAAYSADDYSVLHTTRTARHSGHVYSQDCCGHGGILMHAVSGSNRHGVNYIDLYDIEKGKYLGSFGCDLSEVESCIVDKEGYLEIMANNTSSTDYIWKTPINIDSLSDGL